jgi:biopolymer transport protein TolR
MGAQLAGKARGRGRRSYTPLAEINVTPLVDVMLVLLIVFMVAAPLMSVGVPVDLPRTQAPPLATDKDPLFVSVTPDGRIHVQESEVGIENLVTLLTEITKANPDARILVRGDTKIAYGRILEVMGTMSAAGFSKIGLVAELPSTPSTSGAAVR